MARKYLTNRREISQEFLGNCEEYSPEYGSTDKMTLVSHVPKEKKAVILLSTQFNDAETASDTQKKSVTDITDSCDTVVLKGLVKRLKKDDWKYARTIIKPGAV
ncbi:hypothetical protein HHI36_010139, partial [Cryptolaemus montrouzieri]